MVTVKVADLLKMARELAADGYEYVGVNELPADGEIPKSLEFEAYDGLGGGVGFGYIPHIEVDSLYKID